MTPGPADMPDEYYVGLGRATAAAARLEVMLAQVVVAGERTDEDYIGLAGKVGQVMRRLEKLANERGSGHPIGYLYARAKALLELRSNYVHAMVFVREVDGQPVLGLHHPKSRTDLKVPTGTQWGELRQALDICAVLAIEAANSAAADSPRTGEAQ